MENLNSNSTKRMNAHPKLSEVGENEDIWETKFLNRPSKTTQSTSNSVRSSSERLRATGRSSSNSSKTAINNQQAESPLRPSAVPRRKTDADIASQIASMRARHDMAYQRRSIKSTKQSIQPIKEDDDKSVSSRSVATAATTRSSFAEIRAKNGSISEKERRERLNAAMYNMKRVDLNKKESVQRQNRRASRRRTESDIVSNNRDHIKESQDKAMTQWSRNQLKVEKRITKHGKLEIQNGWIDQIEPSKDEAAEAACDNGAFSIWQIVRGQS